MRVVVVGSMAYDSVETWAGKRDRALGGSATFFSIASARFAPTEIVAVIGRDFRNEDLERLASRQIGLAGVQRAEGETFRWGGVYSRYFETRTTLFTELNVFSDFKPALPQSARAADVVFLANIHPRLQLDVLDQVTAPKFVALDTMNFWIAGERQCLEKVLKRVDLLLLNDEEAFALSGSGNMFQAAAAIQAMGPRAVVIKRGEHGAWLFVGERAHLIPAVPLDVVVDPTGAGDSFAGGFIGWLARRGRFDDDALGEAMVAGTLMASFTVQDFSVDGLDRATDADLVQRHMRLQGVLGNLALPLASEAS